MCAWAHMNTFQANFAVPLDLVILPYEKPHHFPICSIDLSFCGQNPSGSSTYKPNENERELRTPQHLSGSIPFTIYGIWETPNMSRGEPSSSTFWFSDDLHLHCSGLYCLNLEIQYRGGQISFSGLSAHVSCACLTVSNKRELHVLSLKIHWNDKKSLWGLFPLPKIHFVSEPPCTTKKMNVKQSLPRFQ